MPPLSESVELGPGRVASYEVIGQGPPLLYFMGGPGCSAALLRDEAELLSDRFAVYLIDPHGSGGSTPPSDPSQYDPAGHARFYDEVRRALGIEAATIMGVSFGALVALSYAAMFPDATRLCISVSGRVIGAEVEDEAAAAEMRRSWHATPTSPGTPRRARPGMSGRTGFWPQTTYARPTR